MPVRGVRNKSLVLLCVIIILVTLCISNKDKYEDGPGCPDLNPQQFEETLQNSPITFVKQYANWCPHCTKLTQPMNELANHFSGNDKVSVVKIDVDKHNVAEKYGVRGFPTLRLYKKGTLVEDYNGPRDVSSLKSFINKHI